MIDIKYGVNPHQVAQLRSNALSMNTLRNEKISFNALQDILVTGGIASATTQVSAIFVKHKHPLAIGLGSSSYFAVSRLVDAIRRSPDLEFGAFIVSSELDGKSFDLLRAHRFHTIAATAFDARVVEEIYSSEFQEKNRGVTAVTFDQIPKVEKISYIGPNLDILSEEASIQSNEGDIDALAIANTRWTSPLELALGLRTLANSRTISVVILEDEAISMVRSGFYDGIGALSNTLKECSDAGIDLSRATVLTDGCFGVRHPTSVLASANVGRFVFSGGKANDGELVNELDEAGIAAICTRRRYFYY